MPPPQVSAPPTLSPSLPAQSPRSPAPAPTRLPAHPHAAIPPAPPHHGCCSATRPDKQRIDASTSSSRPRAPLYIPARGAGLAPPPRAPIGSSARPSRVRHGGLAATRGAPPPPPLPPLPGGRCGAVWGGSLVAGCSARRGLRREPPHGGGDTGGPDSPRPVIAPRHLPRRRRRGRSRLAPPVSRPLGAAPLQRKTATWGGVARAAAPGVPPV